MTRLKLRLAHASLVFCSSCIWPQHTEMLYYFRMHSFAKAFSMRSLRPLDVCRSSGSRAGATQCPGEAGILCQHLRCTGQQACAQRRASSQAPASKGDASPLPADNAASSSVPAHPASSKRSWMHIYSPCTLRLYASERVSPPRLACPQRWSSSSTEGWQCTAAAHAAGEVRLSTLL